MGDSKKKLYTDARWNDTAPPIVIGHRELTEEEKKYYEQRIARFNKEHGIKVDNK